MRALIETPIGKKSQQLNLIIGLVNFFVIHISYEKTTQCRNMNELLLFLDSFDSNIPQILLGDFNTYFNAIFLFNHVFFRYADYEYPVAILSNVEVTSHCRRTSQIGRPFRDSWTTFHKDDNIDGRTFSLMPWPGLQSRPDRILTNSESFQEHEIITIGTFFHLNEN